MYKLMINDIFMTSVSMFRETLNKDGSLKLGFYKDVQGVEDIASIESLLSDLQTYVMEKSIKNVKILDNNIFYFLLNKKILWMPKNVKKTIFPTLALPRSGFRVVNESPLSL